MNSHNKSATKLLKQMTLDEKIAQMGSCWAFELSTAGKLEPGKVKKKLAEGIGQITRIGGVSALPPVEVARTGNKIQQFLVENTRLGIPAILHEEACSGAMMLGGTMFPQMIGLASTFQPELAEKMAIEIRKQLLAVGARQALAPMLDVSRDPRWGRTEESFGEDSTLVANFGVACVKGLQGEKGYQHVLATGKHFIGHSLSMGGLNCGPVQVGLHEIYENFSGPFLAAIRDAGIETMMNAYPELDGEVVATSRRVLNQMLREDFGFDGMIVSDYEAIMMIKTHHAVTNDLAVAAKLALEAGIEVELPTVQCYGESLKRSLESVDLSIDLVDKAVLRHLEMKFNLGLFEYPYVDEGKVMEVFETTEQRELAKDIAKKSIVLLKNDGMLPLKNEIKKLAVIGPNADNPRSQIGDYSYGASKEYMIHQQPEGTDFTNFPSAEEIAIVSVLEGISDIVPSETELLYAQGSEVNGSDQEGFPEAVAAANDADAVVLVLGDKSGLVPDCTTGEFRDCANLQLPGQQKALAEAIFETGKPVAVVLINGRPYEFEWLDAGANAILEAWLPGEEGGAAVAETLVGLNNPGGKLTVSFPRSVGQLPVYYNHKKSGLFSNTYGDYVDSYTTPLYPFGHGLSYTWFRYSDFQLSQSSASPGDVVEVSVRVQNAGDVAGDEVVQLYVQDVFGSSPRPVLELKGYKRVWLDVGESRQIIFHLSVNQLAFYNNALNLVLEEGLFKIKVGSSSADLHLEGELTVKGTKQFHHQDRIFECPVSVQL